MNTLPSPLLRHPRHDVNGANSANGSQRVAIAVALAPILLLLALTLVVAGLIGIDVGVAVVLACGAWLGYELHQYQKTMGKADQAAFDRQTR